MDIPAGFRELTEATGFTAANGPWFEKVEGNRVWRGFMPGPQHANALGIVHGGMLAAFIDAALGSVVYHAIDRRCVTLKLTLDYLTPARVGDWLEGRGELIRQTRTLLFTNIYLTVGEQKILRASSIAKISSGDGTGYTKTEAGASST